MTEEKKIEMVMAMTDESDRNVILAYLAFAREKIVAMVYPTGEPGEMPAKYGVNQCDIAVYMLNKRGAEGEIQHVENGITRSYESGDIPASLLRGIVPYARIV